MKKIVIDFINNHWDEVIDLPPNDYYTKKEILKLVKKHNFYLKWVFQK